MIRDEGGAITGYVYLDLSTRDYGNSLNAPTGFFTSIVEGCV